MRIKYYNSLGDIEYRTMGKGLLFFIVAFFFLACNHLPEGHRVVICIPVYGQSLALGEEAERITNFDSLANYANGRIVTEKLDYNFGYFDNNELKELAKKIVKYQKRSYELSIYTMAQRLADQTGNDTLVCIFPGGQGATAIANLSQGTPPYQKFMEDIKTAYQESQKYGWEFKIPAICWMQGESDIVDYPNTDYQQLLLKIWEDMNRDIRQITQSKDTIPFICYQANSLTRATKFNANAYECIETSVPQTFVNLLRDNKWFWASGPTYPYPCVGEKIHIDATGQQLIGELAARSALDILKSGKRNRGLIPTKLSVDGNDVIVQLNVPSLPLVFDTLHVSKAAHYGFSVINKENQNIAEHVIITGDSIRISCSALPNGCKVRYAVNGDHLKSGHLHGPRGNLRDSSGNWCYQFDQQITSVEPQISNVPRTD